jgi:RNA 2',3'-cyclic 3'-phosphodiesterase
VSSRGQPGRGPDTAARTPGPSSGAAPGAMKRVFVAVPLPRPAIDEVTAIVETVRAAANPDVRDVRWVRLDGLHLTLRFIGPVDAAGLTAVGDAMDRAALEIAAFDVAIEGAGAFPSLTRPRALWLDVTAGEADLATAAALLDDALEAAGFERNGRPYRAHLTVARADGIRSGADVARRLIDEASGRRADFTATELVLFETVGGGGPARYVRLREARLPVAGSTRNTTVHAQPR